MQAQSSESVRWLRCRSVREAAVVGRAAHGHVCVVFAGRDLPFVVGTSCDRSPQVPWRLDTLLSYGYEWRLLKLLWQKERQVS